MHIYIYIYILIYIRIYISLYIYIYIHVYTYICVCVCVCVHAYACFRCEHTRNSFCVAFPRAHAHSHAHTHTHTHTRILAHTRANTPTHTWIHRCKLHWCDTWSKALTVARLPSSDALSNALPCSSTDKPCPLHFSAGV